MLKLGLQFSQHLLCCVFPAFPSPFLPNLRLHKLIHSMSVFIATKNKPGCWRQNMVRKRIPALQPRAGKPVRPVTAENPHPVRFSKGAFRHGSRLRRA